MCSAGDDISSPNFWMDKAESIKTSGRWSAINKQVERLASDSYYRELHFEGKQNDWMFEVFASLCAQILEEYVHLKKTYDAKPGLAISEIAWRTRNLLELFIWSGYCSKSTENARQFYEDAGRDMRQLADKFIDWGKATGQDQEWLRAFVDGREKLKEKMAFRGMHNLEAKYKRVNEAAGDIGYPDFQMDNRLLSKFAHPTALLVLRSKDLEAQLREPLFGKGCMFFCGAFDIVEIWLRDSKEKAA